MCESAPLCTLANNSHFSVSFLEYCRQATFQYLHWDYFLTSQL